MVNWSLKVINKYGKVLVTLVFTILIISVSVAIAYLDTLVFDHSLLPALYLSFFIPALIAPPTIYFLLTLIVKLSRIEKELETAIESAGDAFFIYNRSSKILDVNEAACQSHGYRDWESRLLTGLLTAVRCKVRKTKPCLVRVIFVVSSRCQIIQTSP